MINHADAMNFSVDYGNDINGEGPVMHTLTSAADFKQSPEKKKKGFFKKQPKQSDAIFEEFYQQKMTFTEEVKVQKTAQEQLQDMGRDSETYERNRSCWMLFTCKDRVWREYMKQNKHGECWLVTIMIIQILYIVVYLAINTTQSTNLLTSYDIFNAVILFWLMLFCLRFLWNSIRRLMISELKIAIICFAIMNIYMTLHYIISVVNITHDYEGSLFDHPKDLTVEQIFARILYIMDWVGIGFNILLLALYSLVTYYVYKEMMLFILEHLDGNRIMWNNFKEITTTRGIIKLDILANLEFFSSFSFIVFQNTNGMHWAIYVTLSAILVLSLLIQCYGGYGTIISADNCYYRTYFTLRALVELVKITIVIMLPAGSMILWEKVEIDTILTTDYVEFIAFVSLSVVFTISTTIWSTVRIANAQKSRRRNQSAQIKAMWRVEETHFNPKNNANYMTKNNNELGMGYFSQESMRNEQEQKKNQIVLRRILKIME